MMKEQKSGPLPLLGAVVCAGALGFACRIWMLRTGYDAHGIQISGSTPYIVLWILSLLSIGGVAALCRYMGSRDGLEENQPASPVAGIGTAAAGLLLLAGSVMSLLGRVGYFDTLVSSLGAASGLLLVLQGRLRAVGKPNGIIGIVVTIFTALYLVDRFRVWSVDPLLGDYCFQLLACVSAMLAAYYQTGFSVGKGARRASIFCSMICVIFCCISLADKGAVQRLYFGAMALWQLLGVCSLDKPRGPRRTLGGGKEEAA